MIGIICAMQEETDKINALMSGSEIVRAGGLEFMKGCIGNQQAVTTKCGMGKVFAAMYAQVMIDEFKPDIVLSFGAAGSLSDDFHIGDTALTERVVQHDMDVSPIGFKKGEIAELSTVWFECDKRATELLYECAKALGIPAKKANAATGDTFVSSVETKNSIRSRFNADLAEMEGGAIAQVCAVHGVPFEMVRAITDEADGKSPEDFAAFLTKATDDACRIVEMFCGKWKK